MEQLSKTSLTLLSWGANNSGQLGQGTTCEQVIIPTTVSLAHLSIGPQNVKTIIGGAGHTLLLSDNGSLYGCGSNYKNQLLELPNEESSFKIIPSLSKFTVKQIETKWDTSYAVSSDGICLSWGPNRYHQRGRLKSKIEEEGGINAISSCVKQVASGLRHFLILKEDGSVYSAGDSKKAQLGRSDDCGDLQKVEGLDDVVQIACGQNHNLALTSTGKIVGWGCNKFGQLTSSNNQRLIEQPTVIGEVTTTEIQLLCGWTHSGFLDVNGKLTNWGRNKYCQLGIETSEYESEFQTLKFEPFKNVVFGSEHCLGLTVNEVIVSWGWNEHGNCGTGHTDDVKSPSVLNVGRGKLIGVGTGQSFGIVLNE